MLFPFERNGRAPIIDGGSDSGSESKSIKEAAEQGAGEAGGVGQKSKLLKNARELLAKSGDLDESGRFALKAEMSEGSTNSAGSQTRLKWVRPL